MLQVHDGSRTAGGAPSSRFARDRRIAKIGLSVVADNGRCLASYEAATPPATRVHDPIESEALRLAELIRTEHKRTGNACGDHRSDFEVPDWSCQDVFYRALAMLNKDGMRLASFTFGQSEGMMRVSFFDVPTEEEERSVWDMLPSDCNPPEYGGA